MADWLRLVLTLAVGAHGVGHLLFLVPLLGVADWGQPTHSWLMGDGWAARGLGSLLWLLAAVGFTIVAVGIFGESNWWRPAAIVAAVASTLGLFLFWVNPQSSPAVSALMFNLLVLGSLLVFHWPPATATS